MNKLLAALLAVVAALFLVNQSVFMVNEGERAVVLRLGELTDKVRTPGLHFKAPFVDSVQYLENRNMVILFPKAEIVAGDSKKFEVDCFVVWRIADNPGTFVRTLRTEAEAAQRLERIVVSNLRKAIGKNTLLEIVSTKRADIMKETLASTRTEASAHGVEIVDIRIKRTELPNKQAVFDRMNAEFERLATRYRFEGESEDRRIRSEAEMERDTTLAEARRQSLILRGEADARAMDILAKAIAEAPEFYGFLRTLDVYRRAFKENSRVILSTDEPLLQYLR